MITGATARTPLYALILLLAFGCTAGGQVIYDFEANNAGFTIDTAAGKNSSWAWGVPTSGPGAAHSGTRVWATNLSGNYGNNEDSSIVSPVLDLSAWVGRKLAISWWQFLKTSAGDWARVDVSSDGGESWQTYYNPGSGPISLAWSQQCIELPASYATDLFRLRFYFYSDAANALDGWYIDDLRIAPQPTVTLNQAAGQADPTLSSPIRFTAVFSEPVTGFNALSDVNVWGAGAKVSKITDSGDRMNYTIEVNGMTSSGTVTASIPQGAATYQCNLETPASTGADNEVTYDVDRPSVQVSKAPGQRNPAKALPICFTVTFNEPVVDCTIDAITVEGTAGVVQKSLTPLGDDQTFTLCIDQVTQVGTVVVSLAADKVHDRAGNGNTTSTGWENEITYDNIAPTLTIGPSPGQENRTNSSSIYFQAQFSEDVSGFDRYDVTIGGTAQPTTYSVSGYGSGYTITVTGMQQQGTVTAAVRGNAACDGADNCGPASSVTSSVITYDTTAPAVTINQAPGQKDPTNAEPVNFVVSFSEPVQGFTSDSVSWNWYYPNSVIVTDRGDGMTFDVAASGLSSEFVLTPTIGQSRVTDLAGNPNAASTSTDNEVAYDPTAPTVTVEQAATQADPTISGPIVFTATFSEPMADFDGTKVTIGGTAGATTAAVTDSGNHKTFSISVTGMTGSGTVMASVANGAAHDAAGNGNTASTSNDNTVMYDVGDLTVAVNQAPDQTDPTNSGNIKFIAQFNKVVSDFDGGDVVIGGTAGANSVSANAVLDNKTWTYDNSKYEVHVSGMTGPGTVSVTIPEGGAHDASARPNQASTSTDNEVTFDNVALKVTVNQAAGQKDPTNALPIYFTAVFSKPVLDFAAEDVGAGYWGTGTPTIKVTDSGDHMTYGIEIGGALGDGSIGVSIGWNAAHDVAGNGNEGSTSTDNSVTLATNRPTATVSAPGGDLGSPVVFNIAFSEPVYSFDTSKVAVVGGTAGAAATTDDYNWTLSVIPTRTDLTCKIRANAAINAAGNGNTASNTASATIGPPANLWAGLRMVSLPIIPDEEDPQEAVGFAHNWWMIWDPDTQQYIQYYDPATFFRPADSTPGRGFWAKFEPYGAMPKGGIPAQNQERIIHLKPGWNLIGNPFVNPVTWDRTAILVDLGGRRRTLRQAKSLVGNFAWGWNGWDYYMVADKSVYPQAEGQLKPWEGYWVVAVVECDLILPTQ